ncbi:MAG: hypothetical protein ACTSO7_15225 [Candidatus Heimdallarchaeota archaeon]
MVLKRKKSSFVTIILIFILIFQIMAFISFNTIKTTGYSTGLIEKWTYQTHTLQRSSPVVADINNDWQLDIIAGSYHNTFCLDSNGKLLWNNTNAYSKYTSPLITDLNKDNIPEIITSNINSGIHCLNTLGNQLWNYSLEYIRTSPVSSDINNDSNIEILVGSDDGLYCINSNGTYNWHYPQAVKSPSTITLMDLDLNKEVEILFATQSDELFCLFANGTKYWSIPSVYPEVTIADIDLNGLPEILLADFDRLACLNASGGTIWEYLGGGDFHSICVEDVSGNATPEIIFCLPDNNAIRCIDWMGNYVWTIFLDEEPNSLFVFDLRGLGLYELVIGTSNGEFCSYTTETRELLWKYSYTTSVQAQTYPCLIDIENDGQLEILLSSNNDIICLELQHEKSRIFRLSDYCFQGTVFRTGNIDSDYDLIDDLTEIQIFGTDPNKPDSDQDGLLDGEEFLFYHTLPLIADSDGDGFLDGEEIDAGTDPLDPNDNPKTRRQKLLKILLPSLIGFIFIITTVIFFIFKKKSNKKSI